MPRLFSADHGRVPGRGGVMRPAFLAPILMLGLAACGPGPEAGNAANLSSHSKAALPANAATPAAGATAKPEALAAQLVLEGGGLRIVERASGAERRLAFDTPMAETILALTRALGRPPSRRDGNEECGGGSQLFAAWDGDLTAWFQGERFVGWESEGRLKTADGLGIGSTREAVEKGPFEVEESTLGTEFSGRGGLSGLLETKAPKARVTDLWAGSTCVFR